MNKLPVVKIELKSDEDDSQISDLTISADNFTFTHTGLTEDIESDIFEHIQEIKNELLIYITNYIEGHIDSIKRSADMISHKEVLKGISINR